MELERITIVVRKYHDIKDADIVVEAVVERIDIKHQIYEKIFSYRKAGAIVSSNTSSIPIKILSEKLNQGNASIFQLSSFDKATKKAIYEED